ncbi:hypothetical protein CCACVL1_05428 [Corchorus capsularis]|uniref:Uncharacterized protein n=1 Tax=Corchorus capsularis TaxID=210143 RepID=A0A1R3JKM6_COCAP|nr:hypothetical protein CCACVL1_05428 [Corchorus capsularis]
MADLPQPPVLLAWFICFTYDQQEPN